MGPTGGRAGRDALRAGGNVLDGDRARQLIARVDRSRRFPDRGRRIADQHNLAAIEADRDHVIHTVAVVRATVIKTEHAVLIDVNGVCIQQAAVA